MLASNPLSPSSKFPPPSSRQRIEQGLRYGEFDALQTALSVPAERLAKASGIHPRTLQRRRKEGVFTFVESDRLYRFQDLYRRASEMLESEKAAASWLTRPSLRCEGMSPLEYAATEPGYQELLLVIDNLADDSFG
jgi:putative toxin-antitoxin system antitoxin component (TIGR02293 family)